MKLTSFIRISVIAATCLLLFSPNLWAGGEWQYEVTPYLWAPNIDGELNYDVPSGSSASPGVTVGPTDYLEHLEMAGMIMGLIIALSTRFSLPVHHREYL